MKILQMFLSGNLYSMMGLGLLISVNSYSQKPDRNSTVSYINEKLAPVCIIEVKGGTIIADYYDKDGQKIRQDKVPSFALDTVIIYEPADRLLSVNCTGDEKYCVSRTLFMHKIKKDVSRISFVVEADEAEGLKKALQHLIRIDSEFKYKDEITFE
jgi:hypothetical protein